MASSTSIITECFAHFFIFIYCLSLAENYVD
jgi:hypothetical protein